MLKTIKHRICFVIITVAVLSIVSIIRPEAIEYVAKALLILWEIPQ